MQSRPGKRLRHALERSPSRRGQIGCTFLVAAVLALLSYPFLRPQENDDDLVINSIVGGAFLLLALWCVYGAFRQILALRTRQTVLELDHDALRRGFGVSLLIRQHGPAEFESLRVELVGQEKVDDSEESGRRTNRVDHGPFPVFDGGPFHIDAHEPFERMVVVRVPSDVPPSRGGMEWSLEVSGIVRGRADIRHSFPVRVV